MVDIPKPLKSPAFNFNPITSYILAVKLVLVHLTLVPLFTLSCLAFKANTVCFFSVLMFQCSSFTWSFSLAKYHIQFLRLSAPPSCDTVLDQPPVPPACFIMGFPPFSFWSRQSILFSFTLLFFFSHLSVFSFKHGKHETQCPMLLHSSLSHCSTAQPVIHSTCYIHAAAGVVRVNGSVPFVCCWSTMFCRSLSGD